MIEEPTRCTCRRPGLGIALAGGGGRGLAQIGVLKVLEREGIPVEYVAGTSIGAVIGALYALTGLAGEVERRILDILQEAGSPGRSLFRKFRAITRRGLRAPELSPRQRLERYWILGQGLVRPSLARAHEVRGILERLFGDATFSSARIPLAVTAVDLMSGRRLIFASGRLVEAVYASTALPGLVPPAEMGGYRLVDGGFGEPVPVDTCRCLGASRVIAVDVLARPPADLAMSTSLETAIRADEVARWALEEENLSKADILITPRVEAVDWTDFSRPDERIEEGERAALEKLGTIRDLLSRFERLFIGGAVETTRRCGCGDSADGPATGTPRERTASPVLTG